MNERAYRHHDDQVVALTRAEAGAALDGTGFVWVHFNVCDDDARAWLRQVAKLSDVVVAALLATETRPRFDAFDDGALLNLRGPAIEGADSSDLLASIRLWVAQGQVFSVARHALRALDVIEMQMKACRIVDPGDLVASLASEITIELDPDVAKLGDTLDHCEEVFGDRNALALRRIIARTRSRAIAYRRFVSPQRTALERLAGFDAAWIGDDDRLHLNEAADRAARMTEELEAIRERAALLHEQLTDMRAEMIDTRGLVLSIVALIFLPLTFLTGLIGMNVEGIPYADEPWAFGAIVTLCVVIALAIATYFARTRWFR